MSLFSFFQNVPQFSNFWYLNSTRSHNRHSTTVYTATSLPSSALAFFFTASWWTPIPEHERPNSNVCVDLPRQAVNMRNDFPHNDNVTLEYVLTYPFAHLPECLNFSFSIYYYFIMYIYFHPTSFFLRYTSLFTTKLFHYKYFYSYFLTSVPISTFAFSRPTQRQPVHGCLRRMFSCPPFLHMLLLRSSLHRQLHPRLPSMLFHRIRFNRFPEMRRSSLRSVVSLNFYNNFGYCTSPPKFLFFFKFPSLYCPATSYLSGSLSSFRHYLRSSWVHGYSTACRNSVLDSFCCSICEYGQRPSSAFDPTDEWIFGCISIG